MDSRGTASGSRYLGPQYVLDGRQFRHLVHMDLVLLLDEQGDKFVQRGLVLQHPFQVVRPVDMVHQDAEPPLLLDDIVGDGAFHPVLLDQLGLGQLLLGHLSCGARPVKLQDLIVAVLVDRGMSALPYNFPLHVKSPGNDGTKFRFAAAPITDLIPLVFLPRSRHFSELGKNIIIEKAAPGSGGHPVHRPFGGKRPRDARL